MEPTVSWPRKQFTRRGLGRVLSLLVVPVVAAEDLAVMPAVDRILVYRTSWGAS